MRYFSITLMLTSFVILRAICCSVLRVANEMDVYFRARQKKAVEAVAEVNQPLCMFFCCNYTCTTMGRDFFVDILVVYALKKVIKILAGIVNISSWISIFIILSDSQHKLE
jgi:hypothetical protein